MRSVTIQIPNSVEISEQDLKFRVAAHLYEEGKISSGEGAMIAEVSKRFFIEKPWKSWCRNSDNKSVAAGQNTTPLDNELL